MKDTALQETNNNSYLSLYSMNVAFRTLFVRLFTVAMLCGDCLVLNNEAFVDIWSLRRLFSLAVRRHLYEKIGYFMFCKLSFNQSDYTRKITVRQVT